MRPSVLLASNFAVVPGAKPAIDIDRIPVPDCRLGGRGGRWPASDCDVHVSILDVRFTS